MRMKGPTALTRISRWTSASREERIGAIVAITWIVLSVSLVGFLLVVAAVQTG